MPTPAFPNVLNASPRHKAYRLRAVALLVIAGVVYFIWSHLLPALMLRAAFSGSHTTVKFFRSIGVNATALTPAFLDAAQRGNRDEVKFLVDRGVSPNAEVIYSPHDWYIGAPGVRTALYEAVTHDDLPMAALLVELGANCNHFCGPPNDLHNPIEYALKKGNDAVARLLYAHGGRLPWDSDGADALELRMSTDLKALAGSARGKALLVHAALGGSIASVRALLDAGVDPNIVDPERRTPLVILAADRDADDVLRLVLDHGADIEVLDWRQRSALHVAAEQKRTACLRLLLDRGAKVSVPSQDGYTPLHYAASVGFIEGVQLLLDGNADVNAQRYGRTPLDLARECHQDAVVKLLGEHKR